MKIIFFCGTLQSGKDGVGDYTLQLAEELSKRGHLVNIVALNDKYAEEDCDSNKLAERISIRIIRLSALSQWKSRLKKATEIVVEFNPDWISLQFVPYAYNNKGLPFNLPYNLKSVFNGHKVHVMYHELWVENRDIKGKLLAFLQRKLIGFLHKMLAPQLSHTHVPVYAQRLRLIGVKAKALPVFSNIPNIKTNINHIEGSFTVGFFSQVTYRKEIIEFLKNLSVGCVNKNLKLNIVVIGGTYNKVEKFIEQINALENMDCTVRHTGFLDSDNVSMALSNCNIGITPVPRHLLGKSGSVAAFLSHGIPVAAPFIKEGYENMDVGFFDQDIVSAIISDANFSCIATAAKKAVEISSRVTPKAVTNNFSIDLS